MSTRPVIGIVLLAATLVGFRSSDSLRPAGARPERGDVVHAPRPASLVLVSEGPPDPDLQPGFPVQALHTAGSYHGGPAVHTLVGNIDADPELEILRTDLANGPISAWNHDGSVVPGWPAPGTLGAGYPALGNLSNAHPGLEVFSGHWGFPGKLAAWSGSGAALPGWPRDSANYVATPPALGDVDGDGIDEIFLEEEDWKLHGYRADGTVLPGWPVDETLGGRSATRRPSPTSTATATWRSSPDGTSNGIASLLAYHHDGTAVAGFPVSFPGYVDTFPVVGDVDGDGAQEIVVAAPAGR